MGRLEWLCSHTVGFPAIVMRDRWRGCGWISLDNFLAVVVLLFSTESTLCHNDLGFWMWIGALASFSLFGIALCLPWIIIAPGSFLSLAAAFSESTFQIFERPRYGIPETHVGTASV